MAGVARENVSRTLREWRDQKLITRTAHSYTIHDLTALKREANFVIGQELKDPFDQISEPQKR